MFKKRWITTLLCLFLCSTAPINVLATATTTTEKTEEEIAKELAEQEKKELQEITIESNGYQNWPRGPVTTGRAAIVMDMKTGAILYAKNIDSPEYPASITKIVTALVALENGNLEDTITVSQENLDSMESGASSIGLKVGEEITLEQGLYANMLASANEASYAIAESVGGDYETFLEMMNQRAIELGATNSNFCNSNGLNDENHKTTAKDMALISAEAYKNDTFREIMQTLEYRIGPTNLTQEERVFQQHHKMLIPTNSNYYEKCTGGKTGFTKIARNTLVTYAEDENLQLVAVVLKESTGCAYEDTKNILEYGFQNFEQQSILDNYESEDIDSIVDLEACVTIPKDLSFSDLTMVIEEIGMSQDKKGRVAYQYEGETVGSAEVRLSQAYYDKTYPVEVFDAVVVEEVLESGFPNWFFGIIVLFMFLIPGGLTIAKFKGNA